MIIHHSAVGRRNAPRGDSADPTKPFARPWFGVRVPRGSVLSDLLVRFALLAALPLACLADAVVVLLQSDKRGGSSSLTGLLLLILALGALLTVVNLISAAQSVRTINTVLRGLASQAQQVAGTNAAIGAPGRHRGEVEWLSDAFRGMVESLHHERASLEHRLADLEVLNRVAGAALDLADAPHYEARILESIVAALNAAGGVFVGVRDGQPEIVAVTGPEPAKIASIGRAAVGALAIGGDKAEEANGALARALGAGEIGSCSPDDTHLAPEYRTQLMAGGVQTVVVLPLLQQGAVTGAIELYFPPGRPGDQRPLDSRQSLLRTVVRLISLGHDHARTLVELRGSNSALERANKLKSEFLAGMSHELRTPMNSIMGYSQVLLDGIDGDLNDEQREDVSRVLHAAESLLAIINDILDLSKIEAGRIELHWQPIAVRELIGNLLATSQPLAAAKALPLHAVIAEDVDVVWGDPTRVSQVLLNLTSNAIKFTHDGHVSITVSREGDRVRFAVRDTGIGIKPEAHRLIFEEFRQADGTTSRRYGGTGLGLAITRRLVQMHGTSVDLVSAEGQGSTFSFTLPTTAPRHVEATAASAGSEGAPPVAYTPTAPLVMVVEDDQETAHLLRRFLESAGFRVLITDGSLDVVASARQHRPRAITLDIILGETDGWQVLQQLKAAPETAGIPVVIVSVLENRSLASALGAAGCLSKPVGRDDLLVLLRQALSAPVSIVPLVSDGAAAVHRDHLLAAGVPPDLRDAQG